jgi:hypothetical protein
VSPVKYKLDLYIPEDGVLDNSILTYIGTYVFSRNLKYIIF